MYLNPYIEQKLSVLDHQIRRRAALATIGYSLGLIGAVSLYLFPFSLSRIGSAILIIALAQMLWKVTKPAAPPFCQTKSKARILCSTN